MNRHVTSGRVTGSETEIISVIHFSDGNLPRNDLDLGVAFEAKVRVTIREQLVTECAVRIMAGQTAFAHRGVLEYKRAALGAVTFRA